MTTKEKVKILGLVFAAILIVAFVGNGALLVSSGNTTPPRRANLLPPRWLMQHLPPLHLHWLLHLCPW